MGPCIELKVRVDNEWALVNVRVDRIEAFTERKLWLSCGGELTLAPGERAKLAEAYRQHFWRD